MSGKKANETQFATYIHTVEEREGKKKKLGLTNFLRLGTTLTKYLIHSLTFIIPPCGGDQCLCQSKNLKKLACVNAT